MESTIPLHQVQHVIRKTSPAYSRQSTPPGNSASGKKSSTARKTITLNLQSWKNETNLPPDQDSARIRIDKILNFFINIALLNDLTNSPAVQILRESLSTLRRGGDFSRKAANKNWRERIAQLSSPQTNHDPVSTIRNLCLHGFPIFNIWDSMSFIYTVCVEDIKTQLGAELHLYQFRMILSALRSCKTYFSPFAGPTTVAASWKTGEQNQPLSVAFATTAVGKGDDTKEMIARARQDFMTAFTKLLTKESKKVIDYEPLNRPGNCPEYLIWPVVCRLGVGKYKSLCFNMQNEWAYRCCGHCERTLEKLGANGIQVDDIWGTAILSTEKGKDNVAYPYRELQSNIVDRYQVFREV